MRLAIIEHEGRRIACTHENCNPAFFRSAIRYVRTIVVDTTAYHARLQRRRDREIARKARQGTPIKYRIGLIREGGNYPFWK